MDPIVKRVRKIIITLTVTAVLVVSWLFLFSLDYSRSQVAWGVTFSDKYARELELDWQATYLALLDDLGASHLRLIAYWDEIEPTQDNFDFNNLDWQIDQAEQRNKSVVLVVGRRSPRWPECHDPAWIGNLAELAIQREQAAFIKEVVVRYKDRGVIKAWQVENEPLLTWFGECPKPDKTFLRYEVELTKSLDSRPVIVTDSGELGHWQSAGKLADTLGVTMYRIVWNKYFGFWDYFYVPPALYRAKAEVTKFFQKNLSDVIVTELQMEPWTFDRRMVDLTLEEQRRSFDRQRFINNINFVRQAGFGEVYLWGAEYWYWLKEQGNPEIWEEAKKLWN